MVRIDTKGLVDEGRLRQAIEVLKEAGDKGLTRKKLADLLGVSLRTADRARELLTDQGALIEPRTFGHGREKRFCMTRGPRWDQRISKEARLALRVAGQALGLGGAHLFAEQLSDLEVLADQAMTSKDRELFQNLKRNVRVVGGMADDPTNSQATCLETILLGFSESIPRELEIEYQGVNSSRQRTVQLAPYCLTQDLFSGGSYLLGWDVLKRRVLQLRLSRIIRVRITGRPALWPDQKLLERAARFQMGGWVSTEEPFEVQVRIRGTHWMQSLEESQPNLPAFRIQREPDQESVLVKFEANHLTGPARWVLQMGEWAEVISPDSLREEVARVVVAMRVQQG